MYRNISIIVLVFFAVVLGLPESQGGGSDIDLLECYRAVSEGEKIFCELSGYDKSVSGGLDYRTCELECDGQKVRLPKAACPRRKMHSPCNEELKTKLQNWTKEMQTRKARLVQKWCP
uniref:Putative ixodes 10 kDa peptide protein n=1 Tax=Ixodes ricinus TaxID=34613 RepID=A0A0K8RK79_IXORI